jgi:hypothetical protein
MKIRKRTRPDDSVVYRHGEIPNGQLPNPPREPGWTKGQQERTGTLTTAILLASRVYGIRNRKQVARGQGFVRERVLSKRRMTAIK